MSTQGIQSTEIGKRFQTLNGAVQSAAAESAAVPGEKLFSEFSSVLDKIAVALTSAEVDSAGLHDTLFDAIASSPTPVAKKPVSPEKQPARSDKQTDVSSNTEEAEQNLTAAEDKKKAQKAESDRKQVVAEEQKAKDKGHEASQVDKIKVKEQGVKDQDTAASAEAVQKSAEEESPAEKKVQEEAVQKDPQVSIAETPVADTVTPQARPDKSQKDTKVSEEQVREQSPAEDSTANADSRSENPDLMKAAARQQVADNKKVVQTETQPREQETAHVAPEQRETKADDAVKQFMDSLRSRLQSGKEKTEETPKFQKQEPLPQVGVPAPAAPTEQAKVTAPVLASLILKSAGQAGGEAAKGLQTAAQNVTGAGGAFNAAAKESSSTEAKETANTQRLPRNYESRTLTKVEEALKEVARSKDGKTISVRLDPPSLGKVQIDVSMRDGMLHARLQADSAQVSTLLREHGMDLQFALRKLGLEVDDVRVVIRDTLQDQQQSFDQFTGQQGSQQEGSAQQDLFEAEATVVDTAVAQNTGTTHLTEEHWVA